MRSYRVGQFAVGWILITALIQGCSASDDDVNDSLSDDILPQGKPWADAPLTTDQRQRVVALLQQEGLVASGVHWERGEFAIIDNLLVIHGATFLRCAEAKLDKGYGASTAYLDAGSIGRIVVTSTSDLSPAWRAAFQEAVRRWNAAHRWEKFRVSWVPPGGRIDSDAPLIIVSYTTAQVMSNYAHADRPNGGRPGRAIRVYKQYSGSDCRDPRGAGPNVSIEDIVPEHKIKVAVHELGHTFGLEHPGDGVLIPGTADSSQRYPSVMWNGCVGNGGLAVASPSADDIKSMQWIERGIDPRSCFEQASTEAVRRGFFDES